MFAFLLPGIPPPRPGMLRPPLVPPLGPAPPGLFPPAPIPNPGVLSAPPSLIQRPKADDTSAATIEKKATATISAKPQITNPKAEITRFVPTALRVRRENKGASAASQRKQEDEPALPLTKAAPKAGSSAPISVQTKDDVYEAFMKEMEGLLWPVVVLVSFPAPLNTDKITVEGEEGKILLQATKGHDWK